MSSLSTTYGNDIANDITDVGRADSLLSPVALLAGSAILAHAPLVALHLQNLWEIEQYQYFPFVLAAIGWLLWSRWREAPVATSAVRLPSLPWWLLAASMVLLAGSIVVISKWGSFVSLIVALSAVFVWIGRSRQVSQLWRIWLLLWLLVPLPMNIDATLIQSLQRTSSQLSSGFLDLVGVDHLMSGNALSLPGKQLFVDEACSGIVSVMSIVAAAATYCVWRRRSLLHLVALTLTGICWAVVMNLVRICTIALAHHYWNFDMSGGAIHEVLGLTIFAVIFLALLSTDVLLTAALEPIDTSHAGEGLETNWMVRCWNWASSSQVAFEEAASQDAFEVNEAGGREAATVSAYSTSLSPSRHSPSSRTSTSPAWTPAVVVSLLLIAICGLQLWLLPASHAAEADRAVARCFEVTSESLPIQIGPWEKTSFEAIQREHDSQIGHYSREFVYTHATHPNVRLIASLDFAFQGPWHELCECYRNIGWQVVRRNVLTVAAADESQSVHFVESALKDEALQSGYLIFSGLDPLGESVMPTEFEQISRIHRRVLQHRSHQLLQVQVLAISNSAIDKELQADLRSLFLEVHQEFQRAVFAPHD